MIFLLTSLYVLLASSLLHDTVEDCSEKLPDKNFPYVSIYKMHPDVNKYVNILTKDKNAPGFSTESYYNKIAMSWQTLIIKVADRTSNCSTIDAFNEKRMEKLLSEHHLDPLVLDYIRLLSNSEHYPLDIYYKSLQQYPEVLVLKLSNRTNTCTTLYNSSDEEVLSYIEECETYIYPLCKYAIEHYPQYRYSVEVMYYHISSICKIVKKLRSN